MRGGEDNIPESYTSLCSLLTSTGTVLTDQLQQLFESAGEPFEYSTARFECDVYVAFRMSIRLHKNRRAWDDLAILFMMGVVGRHQSTVRSDNLDGVFEERVDTYLRCWNSCVDSDTFPVIPCLQMLRMYILGAARRGQINTRSPLDLTGGFMGEMKATPAMVDIDNAVVGMLDSMLKHIMRLSDDLACITEKQIWMAMKAAVLGANDAKTSPQTREKRWWQFWA